MGSVNEVSVPLPCHTCCIYHLLVNNFYSCCSHPRTVIIWYTQHRSYDHSSCGVMWRQWSRDHWTCKIQVPTGVLWNHPSILHCCWDSTCQTFWAYSIIACSSWAELLTVTIRDHESHYCGVHSFPVWKYYKGQNRERRRGHRILTLTNSFLVFRPKTRSKISSK